LDDSASMILADSWLANWLSRRDLNDSVIALCDKDLPTIKKDWPRAVYVRIMSEKCTALSKTYRHKEALDQALRFLREAENAEDTATQIYVTSLIGQIYRYMTQPETALSWFNRADSLAPDTYYEAWKNDCGVFFWKGTMYNWLLSEDQTPAGRLKDSSMCIEYLDRAIADSRKYSALRILALALNVKGSTVGSPANVEEEGRYVKEARSINMQLGDSIGILNTISPFCFYYIDAGQPEKGIALCKEGFAMIARGNGFPVTDIYEALGECYKAAGNIAGYADTRDALIKLRDSMYHVNTERDLADLNATYESQKKENTIIRQQLDLAARKNTLYVISIITGCLALIIVVLWRYFQRRHREQQRRETQAVAAAGEAERRRISADLHDNLGAYAAAAASTIATIDTKEEETREGLLQVKTTVMEMVRQLNDSIWALNKKEVGLTAISDRVKVFIQSLRPAYPSIRLEVEEDIREDRVVSSYQAVHLYRMIQEGVNNAVRHSKCTLVIIGIQQAGGQMTIHIKDNGIGMAECRDDVGMPQSRDVSGMAPSPRTGNGLNNLRRRAQESGWLAEWTTPEGGGTVLTIRTSN